VSVESDLKPGERIVSAIGGCFCSGVFFKTGLAFRRDFRNLFKPVWKRA